jgi:glycosyltransferase involved in cell wall biosynthesis
MSQRASVIGDATETSRPLRVAFDHRIFSHQRFGGISRYFVRVAEHLPEFGVASKIISPLHVNEYLQDLPRSSVWGRGTAESAKAVRRAFVLGEILHRPLASLYGADIVHETYHHPRRLAPAKAKIVTSVYDMIHEFHDGAEAVRRDLALQVTRAHRIICISESTRRDLLRVHPEVADKTDMVWFGFDPNTRGPAEASPHPRPYLLYVGMRWRGYKNFHGLVAAYSSSEALRDEFDLVCVGGGPFNAEEQAMLGKANITSKVFQANVDDKKLQDYYRHAQLFVYPSLYEGFGIPPLEAMAADCPVVCMHISSMPEVCGDAAEYAYPDQPESLGPAIERVVFSPERADALRAAGRERLKLFSWRECARQHAEIYKALV